MTVKRLAGVHGVIPGSYFIGYGRSLHAIDKKSANAVANHNLRRVVTVGSYRSVESVVAHKFSTAVRGNQTAPVFPPLFLRGIEVFRCPVAPYALRRLAFDRNHRRDRLPLRHKMGILAIGHARSGIHQSAHITVAAARKPLTSDLILWRNNPILSVRAKVSMRLVGSSRRGRHVGEEPQSLAILRLERRRAHGYSPLGVCLANPYLAVFR